MTSPFQGNKKRSVKVPGTISTSLLNKTASFSINNIP